jgi:proline dehydrogenase
MYTKAIEILEEKIEKIEAEKNIEIAKISISVNLLRNQQYRYEGRLQNEAEREVTEN